MRETVSSPDSCGAPDSTATVEVRYCAQAAVFAGTHRESAAISNGQTLGALLKQLAGLHAGLAELLSTPESGQSASVLVFVNDQQTDRAQSPRLKDKDRVIILAPMAGG